MAAPLDAGVGRVRVDRLEVLDLGGVAADPRIRIELQRDIAHQVLDELRVLVGALGHPLLVGALEHGPEFTRGAVLGEADQLGPGQILQQLDPHRDMRTLVVGAVVGDLLRAGAQALHRHHHLGPDRGRRRLAGRRCPRLDDPAALVLEQALHTRHRCPLAQEERKPRLDAPGLGLQAVEHLRHLAAQHGGVERLVQPVEPGHEAAHVGALLLGRQRHVEVPLRDGVQFGGTQAQAHRVADVLDAHALDRQAPPVPFTLGVGNVEDVFQVAHGRAWGGSRGTRCDTHARAYARGARPRFSG